MSKVKPSPAKVLDVTADAEHYLKTALKAVLDMKPKTKTDMANVRCVVAQLTYTMKILSELHVEAATTVNETLQAIADKQP